MAKFKVGDKVEDFDRGEGTVTQVDESEKYCVSIEFKKGLEDEYTITGARWEGNKDVLRLTGRPFNVGDKVVIGGEKGIVVSKINSTILNAPPLLVKVDMGIDYARITADGRAWPGTPIIAEHDWAEEGETANKELDEAVKNSQAFSEYQNQKKESFDISPGFASDWPIDNGIDDFTVSPEEVRHIAEMQEKALSGQAESDILKKQHNYTRMALSLTGFKLDKEAAALITETVKKVLELGGEFSLYTACEVEARVNKMYEN